MICRRLTGDYAAHTGGRTNGLGTGAFMPGATNGYEVV